MWLHHTINVKTRYWWNNRFYFNLDNCDIHRFFLLIFNTRVERKKGEAQLPQTNCVATMVKDLKNVGMLPAQIHCIFNYLSILELSEDYCSKPSAVTNVNLLACRKCKGAKIRYWLHQYACPCRQFPEEAKDASVSECTWTLSALEALRNALYKFKSYLLTYLLTYLSCHVWTTVTLVLLDHQHTFLLTSCTVYWLNSAARLVTGTCKFNHGLSHMLHKELYWLDIPESVHSFFMLPPLKSISLHLQMVDW